MSNQKLAQNVFFELTNPGSEPVEAHLFGGEWCIDVGVLNPSGSAVCARVCHNTQECPQVGSTSMFQDPNNHMIFTNGNVSGVDPINPDRLHVVTAWRIVNGAWEQVDEDVEVIINIPL